MADHAPDDVDWVGAQAKCSTQSVFERLRTRVREDVQTRNSRWRYEFDEEDVEFEVVRLVPDATRGSRVDAAVRFERKGRRIEAAYADWDIRRMALDQLFFEESGDDE